MIFVKKSVYFYYVKRKFRIYGIWNSLLIFNNKIVKRLFCVIKKFCNMFGINFIYYIFKWFIIVLFNNYLWRNMKINKKKY